MKDFLKKFQTTVNYNTWKSSENYIEPNVSYITENDGNVEYTRLKPPGSVSTAPVANSLTYNGTAQTVASAGTGTGTMMYRLGDSGDYSSTMPTATNAGSYTLYYYTAESANYSTTTPASISITINKAAGSVSTAPVANSLTYDGTAQTVAITGTGTGTMMYRLGDSGDYSSTMPTATNAGSYTLYYYAAESTNYNATTPASISITINESITPSHNYANDYLTIESLQDNNTIGWKSYNSGLLKTISISTDNGLTWTEKISSTDGVTLATLKTGDKLLIKGSNSVYGNKSYYNYFTSTANFNVEGNIMSMIYGDNFISQTTLDSSGHNFKNLFNNCTKLVSAENLILPATTLTTYCYHGMFNGCTSLTTAPALPATTLATYCYYEMFRGCTSLTTAPEVLPATTLTKKCYQSMFQNCTSLTTAPELPATTLTNSCYYQMFKDCTSLTTAPELPATTLTEYCYQSMFECCTSLTYIKCLATDISAHSCTSSWVNNVAASGTFVKDASMSSWTNENSGIPSGWTVQDAA